MNMDISKLKTKKPWFVPKWLWNQLVNTACDSAKENLKIERIACFAGDAAMDGLQKAIDGKDPTTVATIATTVSNGGQIFVKAGNAILDGKVTDEEKSEVGSAITSTVTELVPQESVDARIEEIRSKILFD